MKKSSLLIALTLAISSSVFAQYGESSSSSSEISIVSILSLIVSIVILIVFFAMANNVSKIKSSIIDKYSWADFNAYLAMGEKQKARMVFHEILLRSESYVRMLETEDPDEFKEIEEWFKNKYGKKMESCGIHFDFNSIRPE
jgi:hypothetical protein